MSAMFDVLFQSVKAKFPKLNWKLGSSIRSLLIDPLEKLSEEADTYVQTVGSRLDLRSILDEPAGKDAELDYWLYQLGLMLPESKASEGVVALVCEDTTPFIVPVGTVFTWNNGTVLRAKAEVRADEGSFIKATANSRLYTVFVTVISDLDQSIDIREGSKVTWDAAPDTVVGMHISSAVSGGITADSAATKAAIIRTALTKPSMCGEEAVYASLTRKFGNAVVDVKFGHREVDEDAIVPIYIKQLSLPRMAENGKATYDTVDSAISWLNDIQQGSPFRMVGRIPVFANVKLQIDLGGASLTDTARSAIAEYINQKKLDSSISDTEIKELLAPFGYSIKKPILYTTEIFDGETSTATSCLGLMQPRGVLGVSPNPIALYCSFDGITTY